MNKGLYEIVANMCENGWTNITVSTLRHYLLICENEGISANELKSITGYTDTPLKNHLDGLKRLGLVRIEVEKGQNEQGVPYRFNRYYPIGPS